MFCKTIILSSSENPTNNSPKGILTLSKENNIILGKVRLYNLSTLPKTCKVGLYINEKVYTSSISHKPNHYEFSLNENIDINQGIYCALIDTANNKKVLLEGGSFNGFCFTDSPFDAVLEAKDEQLEQTIDSAMQNVDTCNSCNCSDCEYKKYFYDNYHKSPNNITDNFSTSERKDFKTIFNPNIESNIPNDMFDDSIQSNIVDKLKQEIDKDFEYTTKNPFNYTKSQNIDIDEQKNDISYGNEDEKMKFLDDIIYQLDEMLDQNPPDDTLNTIIPNSKFVKIENETPYVVGVIYEEQSLKYIAYGVPGKYSDLPPKDLGQHYQWLPLNPRDVMSDGYFMIYQDALTGNLIEINFEE